MLLGPPGAVQGPGVQVQGAGAGPWCGAGLALESRYPGILVPRQLACPQAVFDYESGKKIFLGLQDCRQACF